MKLLALAFILWATNVFAQDCGGTAVHIYNPWVRPGEMLYATVCFPTAFGFGYELVTWHPATGEQKYVAPLVWFGSLQFSYWQDISILIPADAPVGTWYSFDAWSRGFGGGQAFYMSEK